MKNLKVLSFVFLFSVLVVAWCEKANNQEKYSCEGDEVCPVENPSIEIEENPTVIVNDNKDWEDIGLNLGWNLEWDLSIYEWWQEDSIVLEAVEQVDEEPGDEPMMRIMVDENANPDEIEITPSQTCEALGWTWNEWDCTLQDGSKVYF